MIGITGTQNGINMEITIDLTEKVLNFIQNTIQDHSYDNIKFSYIVVHPALYYSIQKEVMYNGYMYMNSSGKLKIMDVELIRSSDIEQNKIIFVTNTIKAY